MRTEDSERLKPESLEAGRLISFKPGYRKALNPGNLKPEKFKLQP